MALIRPLGEWPLLICGPMLRRVIPTSVAVFVATSSACTVEILLSRADGTAAPVPEVTSPQPTRAIGFLLHVVVCELTFPDSQPLVPDVVYAYDIRMTPTTPAGPSLLADQRGLLTGTSPLGYKAGKLPTFSLPPRLPYLHIVHSSCRKPHGGGPDALAIVDGLIARAHDNQFIANTVEDALRVSSLGGFGAWSRMVRQALVWAGESDPCGVMDRIRGDDPSRQNLALVLGAWHAAFGQDAVTAAEAVERAARDGGLREALAVICEKRGELDSRGLGYWLRTHRDRRSGRLVLRAGPSDGHRKVVPWVVSAGDAGYCG